MKIARFSLLIEHVLFNVTFVWSKLSKYIEFWNKHVLTEKIIMQRKILSHHVCQWVQLHKISKSTRAATPTDLNKTTSFSASLSLILVKRKEIVYAWCKFCMNHRHEKNWVNKYFVMIWKLWDRIKYDSFITARDFIFFIPSYDFWKFFIKKDDVTF